MRPKQRTIQNFQLISEPRRNMVYCDSTKRVSVPTYSQAFFDKFGLRTYLTASGPIIQLGAATGKYLEPYVRDGRLVYGYDYSETAIRALRVKKLSRDMLILRIKLEHELSCSKIWLSRCLLL